MNLESQYNDILIPKDYSDFVVSLIQEYKAKGDALVPRNELLGMWTQISKTGFVFIMDLINVLESGVEEFDLYMTLDTLPRCTQNELIGVHEIIDFLKIDNEDFTCLTILLENYECKYALKAKVREVLTNLHKIRHVRKTKIAELCEFSELDLVFLDKIKMPTNKELSFSFTHQNQNYTISKDSFIEYSISKKKSGKNICWIKDFWLLQKNHEREERRFLYSPPELDRHIMPDGKVRPRPQTDVSPIHHEINRHRDQNFVPL